MSLCASGDFFQFGSYSGIESLPILTKVSGPQYSLNLDLCWLANCKLTYNYTKEKDENFDK